jgi:hypothetical protein
MIGQGVRVPGQMAGALPGAGAGATGMGQGGGCSAPGPPGGGRHAFHPQPTRHPGRGAAHHATRWPLLPFDAVLPAPAGHGPVAGVAGQVAGLLVAAQAERAQALAQGLQHLHRRALPALQRAAQGRQAGSSSARHSRMKPRCGARCRPGPQAGSKRYTGSTGPRRAASCRGVVGDPQVALEPDDGDHACQRRRGGWPARPRSG